MTMATTYPQYRKYKNNKVYFKIISDTEWEELHVSANSYTLYSFVAKILPDRNYLADMTFEYEANWDTVEEAEYERLKNRASE